jgi:hypothetical protein
MVMDLRNARSGRGWPVAGHWSLVGPILDQRASKTIGSASALVQRIGDRELSSSANDQGPTTTDQNKRRPQPPFVLDLDRYLVLLAFFLP